MSDVKVSVQPSEPNRQGYDRLEGHLLNKAEYDQLKARRGRGRWLHIISFIPVIIGLVLIIFVFATNINTAFSWFSIEHSSRGGSGQLFPTSEFSKDEVMRQELIARGMEDAEVTTFFEDGKAYAGYASRYANEWERLATAALQEDFSQLSNPESFFVRQAATTLNTEDTFDLLRASNLLADADAQTDAQLAAALDDVQRQLETWNQPELSGSEALDDLQDAITDLQEDALIRGEETLLPPSQLRDQLDLTPRFDEPALQALRSLQQTYDDGAAVVASNDFARYRQQSQQLLASDVFSYLAQDEVQAELEAAADPLDGLADRLERLREAAAGVPAGALSASAQRGLERLLASDAAQPDSLLRRYATAYDTLAKADRSQRDLQRGEEDFNELSEFTIEDGALSIQSPETFLRSGRYRSSVVEHYRSNWQALLRQREGVREDELETVARDYRLSDDSTIANFLDWAPLYRYDKTREGVSQDRIDAQLINGREYAQLIDRNRVERVFIPKDAEEADGLESGWYWVVHTQRDSINEHAPYLAGRSGEMHQELIEKSEAADSSMYLNPQLDMSFLTRKNSQKALMAGFYNAIIGTLWVIGLVIILSSILGVGAAIYLEEYAPHNWFSAFLEVNLRNLAGVPSIVYGILGLYIFVRAFSLGQSVISAALTLTLLILPVVIIASREAIRSVPDSLRQASYGLGATKWQTVRQAVLPNAIPGIVTGVILAVARAIGETAPLLLVGGAGFTAAVPGGWDALLDSFSVMPLQIYSFYSMPNRDDFLPAASAGILVLLIILILIYLAAFIIRARYARK